MRDQSATDQRIARLAERQGGIVSHAQLRGLGLSRAAIHRRVQTGRLHPRYRGVYAVGHGRVGPEGLLWAAVLACGPGAVVSHLSAAAAWDLLPSATRTVDVTVGLGGRTPPRGIRLHRTRVLADDEVTTLRGLPITTPARTLVDLAATRVPAKRLAAALDRADLIHHLDFAELRELLARHRGRRGTRLLNAQLERYRAPIDVRSELERLVYELCDDHGLPRPSENTVIEGRVRDCFWPHCRLVVEADSYAWHRSPSALNADRERDVELTLAGYHVLRFTYEQVTQRPKYVVEAIRTALLRFELA
jgi:very-short-patch-repair endonuclease